MDLTDATDIVFRDVPAPRRHSSPLLDLDLHASHGVGVMGRKAGARRDGSKQQLGKPEVGRSGEQSVGQGLSGVGDVGTGALLVGIGRSGSGLLMSMGWAGCCAPLQDGPSSRVSA